MAGSNQRLLLFVAGLVAAGAAATIAGPAKALDDDGKKNIFSSVYDLFSLGDHSGDDVQFHQRAPLVLPPSYQQLPAPRPSADSAGWMHDRKASGRRKLNDVARSADPDRGVLTDPPNDYFRKAGDKPLPGDGGSRPSSSFGISGLLGKLNPFRKDED